LTIVDSGKKVAVFGHERSGNHFLMNTIALNYGYISNPWWNFDFELGIDFHNPIAIKAYFSKANGKSVLNILKSHHHFGFIEPLLEYMLKEFTIFYVYRDPRDVLISNHKLIHKLSTDEGPRVRTVSEFLRSAPRGRMMRYQKNQSENMVTRWREHVLPWVNASKKHQNIVSIRYEDLEKEFAKTVLHIGEVLGKKPIRIVRPDTKTNVINPGDAKSGNWIDKLSNEDNEFVKNQVGRVLQELGYE